MDDWVSNRLMTKQQAEKIANYEGPKKKDSWITYGFFTLGIVVSSVGTISLIAANWQNIPDFVKLLTDFLLLFLIALGTYIAWKKKNPLFFESLLLLYLLFCLASIGLIAQIYHTGGEPYQALLLWSLMTFGVALASDKFIAPCLWVIGFFTGVSGFFSSFFMLEPFFGAEVVVHMTIPLLGVGLIGACESFSQPKKIQVKVLKYLVLIYALKALLLIEMSARWALEKKELVSLDILSFTPTYVLVIVSVVIIERVLNYKRAQKTLLFLALVFYLLPFHLYFFQIIEPKTAYAACTVLVLTCMALFFAGLGLQRLFQTFLALVGLRFLAVYFEIFGNLAVTGLGLIICGILILSLVTIWHKGRKRITTLAERFFS